MDDKLKEVKSLIKKTDRIVFLGGAGVSTASGIPDFRSPQGLYNIKNKYGVSYETMLSHSYFYSHTKEFYEFYWETMLNPHAKPNLAHIALANFEKNGGIIDILTQNIDGLHQDAGSKRVTELHGSTRRYRCEACDAAYSLENIKIKKGIPCCECGNVLKPDVVLYEEPLEETVIDRAERALKRGDVLIVGGTSLNVYPAASLIYEFEGRLTILINKESTPLDCFFDYVIKEDIGKALGLLLN